MTDRASDLYRDCKLLYEIWMFTKKNENFVKRLSALYFADLREKYVCFIKVLQGAALK